MIHSNVEFYAPIVRANSFFLNTVEKYTWFGGKMVEVVVEGPDVSIGLPREQTPTWTETTWKIASMIFTLGLSLVIALTIRTISRQINKPVIYLNQRNPIVPSTEKIEDAGRSFIRNNAHYYQHIMAKAHASEKGRPHTLDPSIVVEYIGRLADLVVGAREEEIKFCRVDIERTILITIAERYANLFKDFGDIILDAIPTAFAQLEMGIPRADVLAKLPLHLRPGGHSLL